MLGKEPELSKSIFFFSFDCKTCYSAFNGSRHFKTFSMGHGSVLLVPGSFRCFHPAQLVARAGIHYYYDDDTNDSCSRPIYVPFFVTARYGKSHIPSNVYTAEETLSHNDGHD